jgi:hypothetical protein
LERPQAILLIKELLEGCKNLDGQNIQLTPPITAGAGYQVMMVGTFSEETVACIKAIAVKNSFACQVGNIWKTRRGGNQPNTLIIYKPKA